jgi:multidrug transporter EmrE-like cation transporter
MTTYIYVFLTIGLTVYGQIIIKARAVSHAAGNEGVHFLAAMFLDPWVISGLAAALAASATWMMAVRSAELSIVYPIMALTFIIVPILAVYVFGDSLRGIQIVGLLLIVIGVGLAALTA